MKENRVELLTIIKERIKNIEHELKELWYAYSSLAEIIDEDD